MANEKQLIIEVSDKIATFKSKNFNLVGGNNDYDVVFDFDEDWQKHYVKTAIFAFGKKTISKVFSGNICEGVSIDNATMLLVGVFAGDLITTTPAEVDDVFRSILDESNGTPEPPTEDVYNQIMELINRYINADKVAISGGTKGQVLKKNSDKDYDYSWHDDEKALKEVQNISSIDTIYNDHSELPTTGVLNGTRYVSKTNGGLPLYIYDWWADSNEWRVVDQTRGSTIYIVLGGEKAGTYRYTNSSPHFVSIESHTLQNAKDYTDEAIKKYHEENPVKDGVSPTITTENIANGHRVTITDANGQHSFEVMNGEKGEKGLQGDKGDKGDKGDTGKGFEISKTYSSVDAMNAGFATDGVPENSFVIIDTGNVEDEDNAKLFIKTKNGYSYLTDMSGAQGIKGEKGADGKTPEKGVDYWTEADKADIVQDVLKNFVDVSEVGQ